MIREKRYQKRRAQSVGLKIGRSDLHRELPFEGEFTGDHETAVALADYIPRAGERTLREHVTSATSGEC